MQWLMSLETNSDPITACRLMNIFRRKGVKLITLAMAAREKGYSLVALVETAESEVEHIYNFLRRVEGVEHITYYRHVPAGNASFLFVDAESRSSSVARFLESFPDAKLVFASHGKYLLELPAVSLPRGVEKGFGEPAFLPFACVKTTRSVPQPEWAAVQAS